MRLTGRGLTLLACGVAVTIAAAAVGEPDLVWLGLLLVLLPPVGLALAVLLRP